MTGQEKWTAKEVERALFAHFTQQSWFPLVEVTCAPEPDLQASLSVLGVTVDEWERQRRRRIDMLMIRSARKHGIGTVERLAIEVKVTRSDFLQDVRRPEKQAPWRELAHRHAYAVPEGLVTVDEVPDGSGLITVSRDGGWLRAEWAKRAGYVPNHAPDVPDWMVLNLAARAAWAEGKLKGLTGASGASADAEDDVETLRGRVKAAERNAELAENRASRERAAHQQWKAMYAACNGVPCSTCSQPVKPKGAIHRYGKWTHRNPRDNAACEVTRTERGEANALALWGNLTDQEKEWRTSSAVRRGWGLDEGWRTLVYPVDIAPAEDSDEPDEMDEVA